MRTASVEELNNLPPLAHACVDKAIDNVTRKFVGGIRNKKNSQPNTSSDKKSVKTVIKDTVKATSARDALEAGNRGAAWKEMIQKSLSHGISSIKTLQFDGEFKVKNGEVDELNNVSNKPGVYVVFDKSGEACYVGDSKNIQQRWGEGHIEGNKTKIKNGESYKLTKEFEEGCIVKYLECDSVETAAAIEAHLIKTENPRVNSREELKNEQGSRSNIEAKK